MINVLIHISVHLSLNKVTGVNIEQLTCYLLIHTGLSAHSQSSNVFKVVARLILLLWNLNLCWHTKNVTVENEQSTADQRLLWCAFNNCFLAGTNSFLRKALRNVVFRETVICSAVNKATWCPDLQSFPLSSSKFTASHGSRDIDQQKSMSVKLKISWLTEFCLKWWPNISLIFPFQTDKCKGEQRDSEAIQ